MKKISLPIDASVYDVRVTWAGLKEDVVPADAGVVEGFPIDPPDERAGWLLVEFGVEVAKDSDRYWSLWAREKVKTKKRVKAKAKTLAVDPRPKAPRASRKKRPAPEPAVEAETKDETATETN